MHVSHMLHIGEPALGQWERYSEVFTRVFRERLHPTNELSIKAPRWVIQPWRDPTTFASVTLSTSPTYHTVLVRYTVPAIIAH